MLPFTVITKGQKMERQLCGGISIYGHPTITHHNASLGALYKFTSSQDCHLNSEKMEGVRKC